LARISAEDIISKMLTVTETLNIVDGASKSFVEKYHNLG